MRSKVQGVPAVTSADCCTFFFFTLFLYPPSIWIFVFQYVVQPVGKAIFATTKQLRHYFSRLRFHSYRLHTCRGAENCFTDGLNKDPSSSITPLLASSLRSSRSFAPPKSSAETARFERAEYPRPLETTPRLRDAASLARMPPELSACCRFLRWGRGKFFSLAEMVERSD